MKKLIIAAFVLALASPLQAATYFIDFVAGVDSNNGTSKSTPWKRAPKQKGFAGSYTHVAGDRFIFKGGVTWPASTLQFNINQGGASGNPDYYGTDQTWYSGASWSRAKFDGEYASLGGDNAAVMVLMTVPYVTFGDGMELLRHHQPVVYAKANILIMGGGFNVITNALIRDWRLSTTPAIIPGAGQGSYGGGVFWDPSGNIGGVTVTHCEFHQQNVAQGTSGEVATKVSLFEYNYVHHTANTWSGGGVARYNVVHDNILPAIDPSAHLSVFQVFAVSSIYGNTIYNMSGSVAPIELSMGYASSSGTTYVYNNLIWNTQIQTPIWGKTDKNYSGHHLKVFNNTVWHDGGWCFRVYRVQPSTSDYASIEMRNNHWITEGTPVEVVAVTSYTHSNNLTNTLSQAQSLGYTLANGYAPTSVNSPTVGTGFNGSAYFTVDRSGATRTVPWDIGAYEFTGSGGGALGTAQLAAANYGPVAEDAGPVTITANRIGGSTGTLTVPYTTADGSATAGVNYTATSGNFVWGSGDVASKTVNIPLIDANVVGNPTFQFNLSGTVSPPSSATVTIAGTGTPVEPILPGLSWPATDGQRSAPFQLSGSDVYQPDDTQGYPDLGGRLTFSFVPSNSGEYKVKLGMKAVEAFENSVYVNFETDPPSDPTSIFDAPTAPGYATNYVGWRGTGTFEAPEIPLKTWSLVGGTTNKLVIRGREKNFFINHVTVEAISTPAAPIAVLSVNSTNSNSYIKAGAVVGFTVQFSTNVTVTGFPVLTNNAGGVATYVSGSTTDTLLFNYTVGATDNSQDLDYSATNSLSLAGGTIANGATAATLTLPAPGASGSLSFAKDIVVDTIAPTLSISTPSPAITSTNEVVFSIVYSDTNFDNATLEAADITLNTTGTATGTISTIVGEPRGVQVVTISAISGEGTLSITVASGKANDLAGNVAGGAGPSTAATVVVRRILNVNTMSIGRITYQ